MVIQRLMVKLRRPPRTLGSAWFCSRFGAALVSKHHRMHDAAGHQREHPGDHERANKDGDHGVAVPIDAMPPGMGDGERQHREGEDREQVDRAPWPPNAQVVDPERSRRPITMSKTQIQPIVRWGSVPFGAASCTAPIAKAANAANACSRIAGSAFNSSASDTALSPPHL